MVNKVNFLLPNEVAIILGKPIIQVNEWLLSGSMHSTVQYGRHCPTCEDVAKFLQEHPEEVGRVYCDDLIRFFNEARAQIVDILEKLRGVAELWPDSPFPKCQIS